MIRMLVISLVLVVGCSKSADPKPDPKPQATAGSDTPAEAEIVNFCVRSYGQMMDCFKDDEFWQVFSTMYLATTNLANDEVERTHWIGIMKEDLLKLSNEHGFEENCKATVQHNKLPSAKSIKAVGEAAKKSCAAFGSAFGYMVFTEGAFHNPK